MRLVLKVINDVAEVDVKSRSLSAPFGEQPP
jgi:hypothetical protein